MKVCIQEAIEQRRKVCIHDLLPWPVCINTPARVWCCNRDRVAVAVACDLYTQQQMELFEVCDLDMLYGARHLATTTLVQWPNWMPTTRK